MLKEPKRIIAEEPCGKAACPEFCEGCTTVRGAPTRPMKSGLQQRLQVAHIELSPQTKKELDERFVLIYTGQRRLARNLLRDVVGRYVGNEPDSLFALEEIQE